MASDPGTVSDVLSGVTESVGLSEEIAQIADQLQQLQASSQKSTASVQASSR
jgi:hypothetical protein